MQHQACTRMTACRPVPEAGHCLQQERASGVAADLLDLLGESEPASA